MSKTTNMIPKTWSCAIRSRLLRPKAVKSIISKTIQASIAESKKSIIKTILPSKVPRSNGELEAEGEKLIIIYVNEIFFVCLINLDLPFW